MLVDNAAAAAPTSGPSSSSDAFTSSQNGFLTNKRKRRPAGTPDPDAEVVSLSPKTLLESDRYVCEICNQGFQRDQNLQMHRRRHKVPWKLLKRESGDQVKKRVFVCPEPSCLHHHPSHALGDLVGIKKHFRRKHSNNKQWVCDKCSKGYAVQSDYKAHLKTCGTRGHSCDCGRVFSRVESFIEHQDTCSLRHVQPELQALQPGCSSRTASSTSPSSDTNFSIVPLPITAAMPTLPPAERVFLSASGRHNSSSPPVDHDHDHDQQQHNLELQLLPSSNTCCMLRNSDENQETHLKLSVGSCSGGELSAEPNCPKLDAGRSSPREIRNVMEATLEISRLKEGASEQLKLAMAEKALAEEARQQARKQIELAELEFANAKKIRQAAQAELEKAQILKEQATKKISSTILEITCHACKQQFQAKTTTAPADEASLAMSYMSSATEGEGEF
ncbi:zinc finger protein SHOOT GRAVITROPISM 5 [Cornus florida]|uniref:zinc finger protein SHOOT GRAVITROPISM 5 n=1 Tax=Cornus florida TaxID=4283 RepID=UPI00289E5C43|nr:zinc finger protein SHOOT GRAVITROPISM 5 [Cornus florida]